MTSKKKEVKRKPYQAPKLFVYGKVHEKTMTRNIISAGVDGGTVTSFDKTE